MPSDLWDLVREADENAAEREKGEALAARVVGWLEVEGGWRKREVVAAALGISVRDARLAGEYSGGAVVFGPLGMRSSRQATRDELEACARRLDAQAATNKRRAADVRGYLHRGEMAGGLS